MSEGKSVKYKMGVIMQTLRVIFEERNEGGKGIPLWEDGEYFEVEATTVADLNVAMWERIQKLGLSGRPRCHPPVEIAATAGETDHA